MVLSIGLDFSACAGSFALANLAPKYVIVQYLGPILGCFLPISWALTIMRHSEDSRLTTARLVAVPRIFRMAHDGQRPGDWQEAAENGSQILNDYGVRGEIRERK